MPAAVAAERTAAQLIAEYGDASELGGRVEARRLHRRALTVLERAYGPRHRLARACRANLASV